METKKKISTGKSCLFDQGRRLPVFSLRFVGGGGAVVDENGNV
jgi:hypothetical protein